MRTKRETDRLIVPWAAAGSIALLGWAWAELLIWPERSAKGGDPVDLMAVSVFIICWSVAGVIWLFDTAQRRTWGE